MNNEMNNEIYNQNTNPSSLKTESTFFHSFTTFYHPFLHHKTKCFSLLFQDLIACVESGRATCLLGERGKEREREREREREFYNFIRKVPPSFLLSFLMN